MEYGTKLSSPSTFVPAPAHSGIAGIDAAVQRHHLLKHPFYQAWMKGEVTREELRDYAGQYYFHVNRFPRYLSAIHSLCENEEARASVLENLNDEEGVSHGVSHPELWLRFAEGMGVSRDEVRATAPRDAIREVAATFFHFARSSYHEGLGALYAYESQVPEIAASKIEGLKGRYGINDPRTLEFFAVHEKADVAHRESVRSLLEALSPWEKEEAAAAADCAARALWSFLSDVQRAKACA